MLLPTPARLRVLWLRLTGSAAEPAAGTVSLVTRPLKALSSPMIRAGRTAPARARQIKTEWAGFFGEGSYRAYRRQAAAAGVVGAFSGPAVALPALLVLGVGGGVATVLMTALVAGPVASLAMPTLLRRSGGRMRNITLALVGAGDTSGLWVAPVLVLAAAGAVPSMVALTVVFISIALSGFASATGYGNIGVWLRIVLPEGERRAVAPRAAGLAAALSAAVLIPVALMIDPASTLAKDALPGFVTPALLVFAVLYAAAGTAGLAELAALRSFPSIGRVTPIKPKPKPRSFNLAAMPSPVLTRFLRVAILAAFGGGLAPYMSVYAMVVLHASAGYAVGLAAVGAIASVVASTICAAVLAGRSSSRLLRFSYGAVAIGYGVAFVAAPALWDPLVVLMASSVVVSAGAATGRLALSERLFRLIGSADPVGSVTRFTGGTSLAAAGGQGIGALALVAASAWPVFAVLFALTGVSRLVAAFALDVSPSWSSAVNTRFSRRQEYMISERDC